MSARQGQNIMVVDDTPENLRLLVRTLSGAGYRVRAAAGGRQALAMARSEAPDLVLLDIDMPDMNGYQVCEALLSEPALERVPVLFISALHDSDAKLQAFQRGGRDFVTKPFNVEEVLARVETHLELRHLEASLEAHNSRLQEMVAEQVREISDAQMATIVALATLSESRDDTTGMHVERIGTLSEVLARAVRRLAGDAAPFDEAYAALLGKAATLHDIGKVGIPDAVLLKPGRLSADEFEVMKTHPVIGARTLGMVMQSYPRNDLIRLGSEIARFHHEKWDGSGYPDRLAGTGIPLSARMVALVDVYDALRAERPYKPGHPHALAAEELRRCSGTHFDPMCVAAFDAAEEEIDRVWCAMQARQKSGPEDVAGGSAGAGPGSTPA